MTCPAMLGYSHYPSHNHSESRPVNQVRLTAAGAGKSFRVTEASCEAGGVPRAAQADGTPLRHSGGSARGARGGGFASEHRME
jgi:hypothetical protein